MSTEQQPPGSNGVAAATADKAGTEPAPGAASPEPGATAPQLSAPSKDTGDSGPSTSESGALPPETTVADSSSPDAETTGARKPKEGVPVATAVATVQPNTKTRTGVDGGRPRKPVLAGAALAGAALIAIPMLLIGTKDDGPRDDKGSTAAESDTVLGADSSPDELGDYVAEKPKPSPTKEKETPKAVTKTVAPPPAPTTSAPAPKATPKPKPKPKAAPKPDWGVTTIGAPSVLEVNQAWTTNRIRMIMQPDGNLVVYNENNKPIWASMTFGERHRAIFQSDGNLVIHNGDDRPIWASKSHGHEGSRLVLRADAKVVIVHNGKVIWST
ncbi:mannose-binding protein [Streptomyces sp. NPDC102381]|uniref:mannose-binding protein n=1 Tax=Streptomyces sp. NPDC102381 TaxID=3366164 RepID=UPI003825FDE1